jgi:hypothetical protein
LAQLVIILKLIKSSIGCKKLILSPVKFKERFLSPTELEKIIYQARKILDLDSMISKIRETRKTLMLKVSMQFFSQRFQTAKIQKSRQWKILDLESTNERSHLQIKAQCLVILINGQIQKVGLMIPALILLIWGKLIKTFSAPQKEKKISG